MVEILRRPEWAIQPPSRKYQCASFEDYNHHLCNVMDRNVILLTRRFLSLQTFTRTSRAKVIERKRYYQCGKEREQIIPVITTNSKIGCCENRQWHEPTTMWPAMCWKKLVSSKQRIKFLGACYVMLPSIL